MSTPSMDIPVNGKRFQVQMTISLGTIIQIVFWVVLAIVGYATLRNTVQAMAQDHLEIKQTIKADEGKIEGQAELEARLAAIVDQLEKRMSRDEEIDSRRR